MYYKSLQEGDNNKYMLALFRVSFIYNFSTVLIPSPFIGKFNGILEIYYKNVSYLVKGIKKSYKYNDNFNGSDNKILLTRRNFCIEIDMNETGRYPQKFITGLIGINENGIISIQIPTEEINAKYGFCIDITNQEKCDLLRDIIRNIFDKTKK